MCILLYLSFLALQCHSCLFSILSLSFCLLCMWRQTGLEENEKRRRRTRQGMGFGQAWVVTWAGGQVGLGFSLCLVEGMAVKRATWHGIFTLHRHTHMAGTFAGGQTGMTGSWAGGTGRTCLLLPIYLFSPHLSILLLLSLHTSPAHTTPSFLLSLSFAMPFTLSSSPPSPTLPLPFYFVWHGMAAWQALAGIFGHLVQAFCFGAWAWRHLSVSVVVHLSLSDLSHRHRLGYSLDLLSLYLYLVY